MHHHGGGFIHPGFGYGYGHMYGYGYNPYPGMVVGGLVAGATMAALATPPQQTVIYSNPQPYPPVYVGPPQVVYSQTPAYQAQPQYQPPMAAPQPQGTASQQGFFAPSNNNPGQKAPNQQQTYSYSRPN